jgi:hypothetical protein
MRIFTKTASQSGVTLVELAATMAISAAIVVGLWGGVLTTIQTFRDDWVKYEMRRYALTCMDEIARLVDDASSIIPGDDYSTGMDNCVFTFKNVQNGTLLQPHKQKGLLLGTQPLLQEYDLNFPTEGWFREHGQRLVELDDFIIDWRSATRQNNTGLSQTLRNVEGSMLDVVINLSLTTYFNGLEIKEYVTFHRQIFAPAYLDPAKRRQSG